MPIATNSIGLLNIICNINDLINTQQRQVIIIVTLNVVLNNFNKSS